MLRTPPKRPSPIRTDFFDARGAFEQVKSLVVSCRALYDEYSEKLKDVSAAIAKASAENAVEMKAVLQSFRVEAKRQFDLASKQLLKQKADEFEPYFAEMDKAVADALAAAERVSKMQKGDKGDKGDAVMPDLKEIAKMVLSQIKTPENGKDAVLTEQMFEDFFTAYVKKRKLNFSDIAGLEETIRAFSNQLGQKGYMHGGGDTVAAGTNITITTVDGRKVISATGGGGPWGISDGGTGVTSISAGAIWAADASNVLVEILPAAGQSIRRNAGDTAWEAYTPVATGGLTWSEVTGTSQSAAVNNGYVVNNAGVVTVTIPTTAAIGDIVRVVGKGAGGWVIAQNASESINFGASTTTTGAGGSLASTNRYDCVELVCTVANTTWTVTSSIGNITVV